jgi:D-alanine-D-alanine ligase-like ATP-grasp enzyme
VQQKRRRLDVENPNWQVRNHANGFIYARENVNPPQCVIDAAKIVFNKCTELDFGAVDVIYNAKQDRAYVLEINSAPGLEGQTLQDYADYFPKEG